MLMRVIDSIEVICLINVNQTKSLANGIRINLSFFVEVIEVIDIIEIIQHIITHSFCFY